MTVEPLAILMNAQAGAGRPPERVLARTLAEFQVPAVVEPVEPDRLAQRLADHAGQPMLGVAGGDGSLRTAVRVLAGSGTTLVPFPTGRLNHFARRLGLGTVEAVAGALAGGRTRPVPVGRVNDRIFLNTAVVGAYPGMVRVRERLRPFLTTWPAAAVAALYHLVRWDPVLLRVRGLTGSEEIRTTMFWVGIGEGSFPAPHEAPVARQDGALEIVTLPDAGRLVIASGARGLLRHRRGRPGALKEAMDVMHAPWVELTADRTLPIALDGEPRRLDPPLHIAFEPDAVRVVAPA